MKSFSNKLLTFAGGEDNLGVYIQFQDYWNHYNAKHAKNGDRFDYQQSRADGTNITLDEKERQMNLSLKREILRQARITDFGAFPLEQWVTNPMVNWATFAVVNQMIDSVLPDTLLNSIGMYTELRVIDYGDSASFEITPRDLFVVSKAGHGMREGEVHKQFKGQVTILPILREVTVQVSLYKVLAGKESLAEFVSKVIRSLETEMTREAYITFNTAMTALSASGDTKLKYAGYAQSDLISLAQKVSAYNGGNRAVVVGTPVALLSVLPDDANYRYELSSDYVRMGYVSTMAGYDILAIPQVADWVNPFTLLLDDTRLYVVSPSSDKLVKMVIEGGTMANTTGAFDNANLTQNATLYKSFGSGIATSSVAGLVTLP